MNKIYVVTGFNNMADESKWLVNAFKSESEAQEFMQKVQEQANEIFAAQPAACTRYKIVEINLY